MAKSKFGVLYSQLGPFKECVPCHCFENTSKKATFYVKTLDDSTFLRHDNLKVKEVFIECLICGKRSCVYVEPKGIFEDSLDF